MLIHCAPRSKSALPLLAALAASLMLSACASGGGNPLSLTKQDMVAEASKSSNTKSELAKATEYWGKAHAEKPGDATAAMNYAKNLKAMGQKQQALVIMQEAHRHNPSDRHVNSEYGRLALEFDQISTAQKLLEQADDPMEPDWKVVSARGTVLAKQGKHAEAVPYYERALKIAPDQPSVLNNLAMAHAMNGHADKAEGILKKAAEANPSDQRVAQNLALVLGLQGKEQEASTVAANAGSDDASTHNRDLVRQMVAIEPAQQPIAAPAKAVANASHAMPKPQLVAAKGAAAKPTASIAAPVKGKGKAAKAEDAFQAEDANELVRRLADGAANAKPAN